MAFKTSAFSITNKLDTLASLSKLQDYGSYDVRSFIGHNESFCCYSSYYLKSEPWQHQQFIKFLVETFKKEGIAKIWHVLQH